MEASEERASEEARRLNSEIERAKEDAKRRNFDLERAKEDAKRLNFELERARKDVHRLTCELEKVEGDAKRLSSELKDAQGEVKRLAFEADRARHDVGRLTSEGSASREAVSRLQAQVGLFMDVCFVMPCPEAGDACWSIYGCMFCNAMSRSRGCMLGYLWSHVNIWMWIQPLTPKSSTRSWQSRVHTKSSRPCSELRWSQKDKWKRLATNSQSRYPK
jgi:hypothetical protein